MDHCRIGVPSIYFDTIGKIFTFIQKQTVLDHILFEKYLISKLTMYKALTECSILINSDHLRVFAELEINCTQHFLHCQQKLQLPDGWTEDVKELHTNERRLLRVWISENRNGSRIVP